MKLCTIMWSNPSSIFIFIMRNYQTYNGVPIHKFRCAVLPILPSTAYGPCYRVMYLIIEKVNKSIWRNPVINSNICFTGDCGSLHLKQFIQYSFLKSIIFIFYTIQWINILLFYNATYTIWYIKVIHAKGTNDLYPPSPLRWFT